MAPGKQPGWHCRRKDVQGYGVDFAAGARELPFCKSVQIGCAT